MERGPGSGVGGTRELRTIQWRRGLVLRATGVTGGLPPEHNGLQGRHWAAAKFRAPLAGKTYAKLDRQAIQLRAARQHCDLLDEEG